MSGTEQDDSVAGMGVLRCAVGCIRCGYNLRGLDFSGNCPECGEPVARSLRGEQLADEDPATVRRIALGLRWWAVGWVVWPALLWLSVSDDATIWLINAVPGAIGCWLLTTPTRAARQDQWFNNYRLLTRLGLAVGKATFILFVACEYALSIQVRLPVAPFLLSSLALVALGVGCVAVLGYERKLAASLPEPRLARQFDYLAIGYAVAVVLSWMNREYDLLYLPATQLKILGSFLLTLWQRYIDVFPIGVVLIWEWVLVIRLSRSLYAVSRRLSVD